MKPTSFVLATTQLTLVAVLAGACAGSGPVGAAPAGPSASPSPSSSRAAAPPAQDAGAAAPPSCGGPQLRAEMLRRVNALRAQGLQCGSQGAFGAAPALAWNEALARAATAHSRDMAARNYLEHEGQDGSTSVTRVEAQGYLWSRVAENIAGGQPGVAEVVDSWRRSPGHCANLMKPELRHLGAACVRGPGTRYGTYWTLVLGTPQQHLEETPGRPKVP
jgi:uncharacterized protein YkwD